jgi:signal transduction histidine kinase
MNPFAINPSVRAWSVAAVVLSVAALMSGALIWQLELSRLRESRALVSNLATERAYLVGNSVDHALSATLALAALVRQGNGTVENFPEIAAQMLPLYPGASSLALAPAGVVREIIPLRGNEKAIGHDLLKDPQRTKEAFLARDTGRLTLAGPFELVQGGFAAAGRMPVFLDDGRGGRAFWGLTAILIKFPDALAPAQFAALEARGFAYALWRIHPDSGTRQVIAASATPLADPVEIQLQVPNATWTLGLSPVQGWGDHAGLFGKAALGLMFSLLLAGLTLLLLNARNQEALLESRVAQRTADLQRFSEITAHHLQEPARRIASYAELLGRQLPSRLDDPEALLALDFIGQQARYLQNLLRDVQRYLVADQPLAAVQRVDTGAVVAQVAEKMAQRVGASGAQITVGTLPAVWVDPQRLGDVFEMLLDNALRHGVPGDTPARPLHIRVEGACDGAVVRLRVSDKGPGIEAQYRERVFRAFERLQSGSTDSGVGLALVRRMVESGGGRAWIEEAAGGGCCVCLELPQVQAKS